MKIKYRKEKQHSNKNQIMLNFRLKASMKLNAKYQINAQYYRSAVINNIIYNEKSHIVALFKDFLIIDDNSEFMKRYYSTEESLKRLPKFFDYYETYSKIFPNYTSILEGKYIYYNIQRKQRIINIQEEMEIEEKHHSRKNKQYIDDVFSTDIYDSIVNDRNNEDLEEILNLYDQSDEENSKLKELLDEIEKNMTEKQCTYYENNLNQSGSIKQIQPTIKNSISSKKKLMISSLLGRNQSLCNSNTINNGKIMTMNNNNAYNNNDTMKCYYLNNNNNTSSLSNSHMPLTDRLSSSSNKKIYNNSIVKPPQSRQGNRMKMIHDYPKTVFNDHHNAPCKTERERDRDNEGESRGKSGSVTQIKAPPKYTNNIIYIINQNPKFMTNVTLFNNQHQKSASTKNMTAFQSQSKGEDKGMQFKGKDTSKDKDKAKQGHCSHVKALSNVQSQLIPKRKSIGKKAYKGQSAKSKIIEQYLFENNQTARTRNTNTRLINKEFLISSREYSNRDNMNLKTSSQITQANKNSSKSNINNFITTTRDNNVMKSNSKDLMNQRSKNDIFILKQDSAQTKKVNGNNNIIHHGTLAYTSYSNTNSNTNANTNNNQPIKGIQIKNFNKVLGLNFSQAVSERNSKKGYYH